MLHLPALPSADHVVEKRQRSHPGKRGGQLLVVRVEAVVRKMALGNQDDGVLAALAGGGRAIEISRQEEAGQGLQQDILNRVTTALPSVVGHGV